MAGDDDQNGRLRRLTRLQVGGDQARAGVFGNIPVSVGALSAILALIYLALWIAPSSLDEAFSLRFGLSPERLAAGGAGPGGWLWAIAPLFSHIFVHATAPHLLFNLLWLVVFGTPVARRFHSPLRFYAYFALCGAAGGILFSLFHLHDETLLVGASGGITGLLGGMARFAFHRPHSRPASAKDVLPLNDRSVLTWAAVVIIMNASIAIFGPGVGAGDADIAWQAHVGGFIFGLIAFPLFDPKRD